MITQARVQDELDYNPHTGVFLRRNGFRKGSRAGCLNKRNGYSVISIGDRLYYAHRLAWVYMHGDKPFREIDHINRNRSDNRITNLRVATRHQNQGNRKVRIDSLSQMKGVRFHKLSGLWYAQITANRKIISLGYHKSSGQAQAAYASAAKEYFGEFARVA